MRLFTWLADRARAGLFGGPSLEKGIAQVIQDREAPTETVEDLEEERDVIEMQLVRDHGVNAGSVPSAVAHGLLDAGHPLVQRWIEIECILRERGQS